MVGFRGDAHGATADPRPAGDAVAVEICVDDVEGARLAEAEGATRIELCSALSEGGLTPSVGLVGAVLSRLTRTGVQVMIRPRGGDFNLSKIDLEVMLADIAAVRALPASPGVTVGFVFGALTPEGLVDEPAIGRLVAACGAAPVTFHRAFDRAADQAVALERLVRLGVGRVLTSGGAATAAAGRDQLAALVRQAKGRIAILAGGGVRGPNARGLIEATNLREIHLRAMEERPGRPPVTVREAIAGAMAAVAGL